MSTDRELLELAAKAAGKDIDTDRYDEDDGFAIRHMAKWWNPLKNDADALRLAVKLTIVLENGDGCLTAKYASNLWEFRDHGDDPLATTRQAIVSVAARMAEDMP